MKYSVNLFRMAFSLEDHLFRIRKAEQIHNLWKVSGLLVLLTMLIYGWMAYLGVGTNILSGYATELSPAGYETVKGWFLLGRVGFALIFAALVLFVPSLIYYAVTDIPYRKLMIMQLAVLVVLLVERVVWVPLVLYAGLDWYVSPLSFGIIASYLTEESWVIYFFGSISLFQLWLIWFQVKYLRAMTMMKQRWLWMTVIFLHIIFWGLATLLAELDTYLINGWFV
ncbi:hypothetical protein [Lentibacillus sediminis]|uniref:hypothetical protein n=1 Tax=Lentibacillus sediminis TaxID=1940529 RepID=UPI000C1C5E82|nr:hypothetical protein [Lentibacillus sediminis]